MRRLRYLDSHTQKTCTSLPVLLSTSSHIRVNRVLIFLAIVGVWFAMAGISFLVDHVVPKDPVDDMPKSRRGKRKWLYR